ncbi:MAG: excinuclease ABC subunit C [Flavobacteriales bacterium]|nr:excinuclease ABC subunit C [Flavobacteriales bacterium]
MSDESYHSDELKEKVSNLPHKPGVYQYFDKDGKIIYVGKAKDLRKRVSSYFNRDRYESGKTRLLVKKIRHVEHIIVANEFEALLLENSMIKEHQPKYNIQLRDDKTYPWICIKKERFPRVFPTRNVVRDGSEYFGPYASVKRMKAVLGLATKLHKVRTCNYALSEENIQKGKFKVCLEFHIGNCLGPCEGRQTEESYNASIDEIRKLVKGDVDEVIKATKERMQVAAEALDFELAAQLKANNDLLQDYQSKSVVVSPVIRDVDVASVVADDAFAYVNFMRVVNGAIIQSHSLEFKKKLDEDKEDLLLTAVAEMRSVFQSSAKEILVNIDVSAEWEHAEFHHPQRGDKKALIDFSLKNLRFFMLDRQKAQDKIDPNRHANRVLKTLKEDLRLSALPVHIECFDNSNFHGSFPVAACVVFKDAKPSKQDYRHFNIKTVEGPDDFASMEEVIYRRYKRLIDENQSLPQLIVVDGGKGQLSSAVKSLDKLELRGKVAVIGIAKKLEEIFFPEDPIPIYIDKRSESLKIIQRMRNEAHRFGITHHRNKRSKNAFQSELLEINGIGEKTAKELLRVFYSLERIKQLSQEELATVSTVAQAKAIVDYFRSRT